MMWLIELETFLNPKGSLQVAKVDHRKLERKKTIKKNAIQNNHYYESCSSNERNF